MNLKRKCHGGTHHLFCLQFSGSTFGRFVSKWKNYCNYCTALNYSWWRKWWQVCRAVTLTLPLGSLSLLMKKALHTTQGERDRGEVLLLIPIFLFVLGAFSFFFVSFFCFYIDYNSVICFKKKKRQKNYYSRSPGAAGDLAVPKSKWNPESETYSQLLKKINWIYFLLLNLLTACHSINSSNVLLCHSLPRGPKLQPDSVLQIFPQQTLRYVMCGNILLL